METVHRIERALNPEKIVVVGASRDPNKFGYWILKALIEHGYKGKIYPVNPKADRILGLKCYQSVKSVDDEDFDLAIVAVPARFTSDVISELGEKDTNVAIVIASGFSEIGEEGRKLEEKLVEAARESNVRIIGPNTLGIINTHKKLVANFGRAIIARRHKKGPIAFLTQSGAFGQSLLCWAEDAGIGFSTFINTGNEADLTCSDFLEYLATDKNTKVIVMYVEGLRDARRFMNIAKSVTRIKPIIALKAGRTSSGARAAASHTGSMAGSDQIYDAAFKQCGILRVYDHEEMFDLAKALVSQPLPRGNRIGILTSSGGLGVQLADACETRGLKVPRFSESITRQLQGFLPRFAAVSNPVDMTSQVHLNPEWWGRCCSILLKSGEIDGLILGISAFTDVEISRIIIDAIGRSESSKPVLCTWVIGKAARRAMKYLEKKVPVYESPERAARVMAHLYKYSMIKGGH